MAIVSTDPEIQQQERFVRFLKERGIYNPFASATTMVAMQEVWDTILKEVEEGTRPEVDLDYEDQGSDYRNHERSSFTGCVGAYRDLKTFLRGDD